jgi:nucleoside-diphosphate-sugar epimerase
VVGFLTVADCPDAVGRVVNLATGTGVTVGELAQRILGLVGRRLPVVETAERVRPETSEVFELIGSAAVAEQLTGWRARTTLDEGLARTLDWMRRHQNVYRTGSYTV